MKAAYAQIPGSVHLTTGMHVNERKKEDGSHRVEAYPAGDFNLTIFRPEHISRYNPRGRTTGLIRKKTADKCFSEHDGSPLK